VEYADKQSDSIYFLFKLVSGEKSSGEDIPPEKEQEVYFLVWTTTPLDRSF